MGMSLLGVVHVPVFTHCRPKNRIHYKKLRCGLILISDKNSAPSNLP